MPGARNVAGKTGRGRRAHTGQADWSLSVDGC